MSEESSLKQTAIQVDNFKGDVSVNRNITMGGNFLTQGNAHIKKNLRVDGYIDAGNIKGPNKGLFKDLNSLMISYPNPENGWWALVGNTLPAQLYVAIDEKWEYSGFFVGDGLNIDLESINDHINDLEQIINEIAANILPFAHKYNTSVGYSFTDEKAIGDRGEIIYFTNKKRFCFCVGSLAYADWHSKDLYMKDELPRGDKLYTMNNRLYQYDGYDVVLLGSNGNSKPIDIVHERGNSEESVMSQKTVTKELDSIENTIKIKERCPVFDGFISTNIETSGKSARLSDTDKIFFCEGTKSFVCCINEKYCETWLDINQTRPFDNYNNIVDKEYQAILYKIFIYNNKLYFWNGEKMIAYEDALPDYYPDDQNKYLMVDGNGNLTWNSIIPTFYDVIKEPYSVNIASSNEFKMAKNTMYFLHKAYFKNPNSTYPLFAKKDDYGNYIIPTDEGLVKDYMTKTNDIFKPILNKIFTCAADGQQYIYDGFQLRVLTNNQQINLTYSELKELINSNSLIPGMKYRIIDFTTYKTTYHITKIGDEVIPTSSDRHPFDVIVTASSNNTLEAKASAALNENDNYFSHFGCNLEKWELEYEIEPDENKLDDYYKGTITYMKDEYGNEATYDFKNIVFDVSNVGNLPDYLDTKQYGSNKRRPIYTFSRLIQNVLEINGINLIYTAYYADNANIPDCYVADASLCNEYSVVLYNGRTVNLSSPPAENNIIKLKGENKALFACTSYYYDGVTLKYGVKASYYTFDIKHKADHNLIINSYGNAYDSKGATVFIIGSTTSFINVNGMLTDNHCMNLSHSYVCVNENGKQIIDLSNLQQHLNNIDENLQNTFNQFWNLQSEFENFKVTDENNNNALATRVSANEKAISSLGTRTNNAEQSIRDLKASVPNTENLKNVKYKSFMSLMTNGNLIPGTQYLISDFVNYYKYTAYKNYNNFISIIVTADSSSTINPYARLADGSATIKIRTVYSTKNISNILIFEGSSCYVLDSTKTVTYNDITYTELYINNTNTGTYYYTYVKKEEWDSIRNGYGVLLWVNYYMPQPLPEGTVGLPKGIKFDPEQHYLKYMNIGEYKPIRSADDQFIEIIWMKDSNGNEAPYEFLHNTYDTTVTFNGTCKNNIIKIPDYYDSMSPISYIKLTDCNGNNITVTNDKLYQTEINSCNNNEILLTPTSKRITLSNIDNSLIVYSEDNTHIHKKTLVQELGDDETSPISQKGVKNAIDDVNTTITNLGTTVDNKFTETKNEVITYTDDITNKNRSILPITFISNSSLEYTTEKPTKPTTVCFNVKNTRFYAKDVSGTYHNNWDGFAANIDDKIINFPDSTIYESHMGFLQHVQTNYPPFLYTSRVNDIYKPALLKVSFFDSEYIEESSSLTKTMYINHDLFIELNNNSKCTINYKRTSTKLLRKAGYYAPIYTSQVIIKTAYNPSITFTIPSTLGGIDEVIWENGEPPVFDSYKYYILDFKEMYIKNDSKTKLLITYKSFPYENPNPDYIDLGLPSGTLWATKNVGAASPEEYGNYYAWGEIETKEEYLSDNCSTSGMALDDISGNSQYDAATANLDTTWKMPTKLDIEELINNCTLEATTLNSVNGYKIIGPNGNSIFVPSGGYKYSTEGDSYVGASFYCWSSTPDNNYQAYEFKVKSDTITIESAFREYGFNIRPIKIITEQS